jgi:hypothetical protein
MFRLLLSSILFFSFIQGAQAQQSKIPEELQQWIPWVLYEQEDNFCTLNAMETTERYCSWPSSLLLNVEENGATFTQKFLIESKSLVPLPGSVPFWPVQIKSNGKNLLISNDGNQPAVWLSPGEHTVTGTFIWNELPEYLFIPPATGLVELNLHGKKINAIQLDNQGRLWFRQKQENKQTDEESLSLQVFRKIEDGAPLLQHLRIQLTVSGSPRQVTLGLNTHPDFIPLSLQSPLPIRFDENNKLQVQVRPGQWNINITLRNRGPKPPEYLEMGVLDGPWPEQEIWVFAADPKLRQVEIKGVPAIDPSRTSLPDDWKSLPAYLIETGSKMNLFEKNRGNPNPVPNRLLVNRKFWLDEQGDGLTVLDSISGTMTYDWRLNVDSSQDLGRVTVKGKPRLITKLPQSNKTGVEVRQGRLALQAESRINTAVKTGHLVIPAIGWDHNVQDLSAELNLPPGWKLFSATGVDKVSTWLNHWSLLDIFLVLIIALATGRILGWGWGAAAMITLILCFHQPGSPRYLWLPLLAALGLQKIISAVKAERFTRISGFLLLLVLIVSSIPYMINEIRVGLFPQLEYGSYRTISSSIPDAESKADMASIPAELAMLEDEMVTEQPTQERKSILSSPYGMGRGKSQAVIPQKIQIDPQEMIQTGPGLPNWSWTRIALQWNGPVKPEQQIAFLLLSPRVNTILAFVRVLLLALLILGFLRRYLFPAKKNVVSQKIKTAVKTTTVVALLLFVSGFSPQNSQAEIPSPEILKELQNRLLAPPECANNCVTINDCMISVEEDVLKITLQVDVLARSAVALPGKDRIFDTILLEQKEADILRLDNKGFSTIRLEPGSHTITLIKDISNRNKLSLSFPILPAHAQATTEGWDLNGVHADGRLAHQISLDRIQTTEETKADTNKNGTSIEIPVFVQVERTLHMNLEWTVSTRIIRKSADNVIALDIPLLPGEHVTSDGFHVTDKHIRINMGPEQSILHYNSSMDAVDTLTLHATDTFSWNEIWFLDVSPIWHVESKGLPEINQTDPNGKRYPEYHPYPDESLKLSIVRPEGVPGPTMTISSSKFLVKPGHRATENNLSFSLTASRGMQHPIVLPANIDLQKITINDKAIPLQLTNNRLILPITPGQQHVQIDWRSETLLTSKTATEPVLLGMKSVNSSIEMQVPSSRWILLTGGPRIGPAVLFWGELLVIILVALLLGRIKLTPLSTLQWLLLSLGLSQIPVAMAAIVVAWLLLLGLRKKQGDEIKQVLSFNFIQVLLVLLTLAALTILFFAIRQGLLGHPDMQIGGNGSSGHTLHWYQDRSPSALPIAWVITVPLLVYRISMLLWALWLAMALLRWLRWGWECFSSGGSWKTPPPRKKIVPQRKKRVVPAAKEVINKTPVSKPVPKESA